MIRTTPSVYARACFRFPISSTKGGRLRHSPGTSVAKFLYTRPFSRNWSLQSVTETVRPSSLRPDQLHRGLRGFVPKNSKHSLCVQRFDNGSSIRLRMRSIIARMQMAAHATSRSRLVDRAQRGRLGAEICRSSLTGVGTRCRDSSAMPRQRPPTLAVGRNERDAQG